MKTGSLGTRSMVCVAFLLYTALSLALLASPVKDVLEGTETDAGVKLPRARRRLQRLGMSDCFPFGAINYVRVRLLVSCRYSLSRFLADECDCAKVCIVATLTTVGTRSRTVSFKKNVKYTLVSNSFLNRARCMENYIILSLFCPTYLKDGFISKVCSMDPSACSAHDAVNPNAFVTGCAFEF